MKFKFVRVFDVPLHLQIATRNYILEKRRELEKEIDLICDENQKVNCWNVLIDDFRIALNVVEALRLLPAYQITAFRNQARELEKKGDAAMNELHPPMNYEAPY